jgi:retron-type reverse transcriptase
MLKLAHENLKSKPGNMTPGITAETLDGISIDILQNILTELKTEKFQFKPYRKVEMPKRGGGSSSPHSLQEASCPNPQPFRVGGVWTRNLLIAPPRDKLVQEVIRMILEAIFESRFQNESHGFRRNRSCHTALKLTKQKFQPSI